MHACAVLLPMLLVTGCALRVGDAEHYIGPVLFRFRAPDATAAAVSQVVRLGLCAEAGSQWGIATGVVDRVAAAPANGARLSGGPEPATPRWRMPLSFRAAPTPGEWNVSLLYLRVEAMPPAALVMRRMYGIEITAGEETNAMSIGWTSRTLVHPPDHAFSLVRFDSRSPLKTMFVTWPEGLPPDPATWIPNKEMTP